MNIIARIICASVLAFSLVPLGAQGAAEAETLDCNLSADAAALKTAEDVTGNEQEKLLRELAARKAFLSHALVCAVEEVRGVRKDLQGAAIAKRDPRMARLEAILFVSLDATESYYASQQSRVGTLGLLGSKIMAREVRTWRLTNFASAKEAVASFLLWHNHRELISAADARLTQIRDTIRILKLEDNEEITTLLQEADAALARAEDGYASLQEAFAEQTIPEKPLEAVRASLDALGETYQIFFDLSETVKTLLPRP